MGIDSIDFDQEHYEDNPFGEDITLGEDEQDKQDVFNACNADFKETDHPRDKDGKFAKTGDSKTDTGKDEDLKYSYEAQKDVMTLLDIDTDEFAKITHLINDIWHKNKHKKTIKISTMEFTYKIKNHGFNNYKFYDKVPNDINIGDKTNG